MPEEVAEMRREAARLCLGELGPLKGLEAGATDETAAMARYMVGVMIHKIPSLFSRQVADPRIAALMRELIGPNVKAVHSQLFFKHAGQPGNAWHQDEMFIPTRDRSLVTLWIALEDAKVENGCLRVFPGSHRPAVLWPMRAHNDANLDRFETAYGFPYAETDARSIEIPAGSALAFDGYLIHGSHPNRTRDGFRRSLLYVYANAETQVLFDPSTYQPTADDYRDIVMIAGTDPYAWKGTARKGEPYLRPAGPTTADRLLAQRHAAEALTAVR